MSRIDVLKKHYEPRLEKYDENSKVLDWESADAQNKRFRAMTDNISLHGKSVLDVGCGCGDLYNLINDEFKDSDYTGVDILKKMVDRAVVEYPDAQFFCADIFSSDFCADDNLGCASFDITYTSGIFNLNAGNNEDFLKKAVPVLADLADEAFIFNLLDPASPDRDDNYFYYEPEKAVELAEPLSSKIVKIEGYLANDYTLICYK
ncbi:MAG: class I SAM-dependent methyltransferase [Spirochaetales bacterium]|uniref:Class I SAM-dependent methyltransferase n=1 Tax=Candidatus Thalassospirochaeta sargassi TaxID=3119039 RepID=A0AAJ1MLK7_9SPIO|nr:class I SAM-dependent methyltransferase [Spirochaetales bacterium]